MTNGAYAFADACNLPAPRHHRRFSERIDDGGDGRATGRRHCALLPASGAQERAQQGAGKANERQGLSPQAHVLRVMPKDMRDPSQDADRTKRGRRAPTSRDSTQLVACGFRCWTGHLGRAFGVWACLAPADAIRQSAFKPIKPMPRYSKRDIVIGLAGRKLKRSPA